VGKESKVAITGIGPLSPIGIGREAFWKGLLKKETGLRRERCIIGGDVWDEFYVHRIENFDITNFKIDKELIDEIRTWKRGENITDLYYLMAAVKLVLEDGNFSYEKKDNDIGLVLTHENPGMEHFFSRVFDESHSIFNAQNKCASSLSKKNYFSSLYKHCNKSAYELQTFMFLYHIAKAFNMHGYSLFINNACASGLYALEAASQMIKCGRCPAVVIAAADHPGIYKHLWFKQADMYARDGLTKPFDTQRNGFVMGDGGIGLLLEDLEHAYNRGAKIYAEYAGGGFSLEGWKVTLPAIGSDYYQRAIRQALRQSSMRAESIDLLCAHGVGANFVDKYEAKAITDVFGLNPDKPLITAFKGYLGHNLGGSALIELAALLLCMDNSQIIPTLNCEEPDSRLGINPVRKRIATEINASLKICCAFAGYNAAAVVKKV